VKRIAELAVNSLTRHKLMQMVFILQFSATLVRGNKMDKIELYINKTDYALIKSALNDLLDKVNLNSDFYGVAGNITDLLDQLNEFHYVLEVK
jgi:hypothetical protein